MLKIYGKRSDFEMSKRLYSKVKATNSLTVIICTCYIKSCLYQRKVNDALECLNDMKQGNIMLDGILYSTLLIGLRLNKKFDLLADFVIQALEGNYTIKTEVLEESLVQIRFNSNKETSLRAKVKQIETLLYSKNIIVDKYSINDIIKDNKFNNNNKEYQLLKQEEEIFKETSSIFIDPDLKESYLTKDINNKLNSNASVYIPKSKGLSVNTNAIKSNKITFNRKFN